MQWTSVDCRDAIIAVYQKQVEPREIPKRFGGVSRQHVTELAAKLPPGLMDDDKRLQVTRMANRLAGVVRKACYTDWELQAALLAYSTKGMKPGKCTAEYGVPGSTLRAKRQKVDAVCGSTPSAYKAKKVVQTVFKQLPGP